MIRGVAAGPVTVDDFLTDSSVSIAGNAGTGSTATDVTSTGGGAIGGERDSAIEILANGNDSNTVDANASGGDYNAGIPSQGSDALYRTTIQYDGTDNDALTLSSGLGPVDLVDGTNDRFRFLITENDFAFDLDATVIDADGTEGTATGFSTGGNIAAGDPAVGLDVPYSSFSNNPDFSQIAGLEFGLEGGSSADLSFDAVTATTTEVPVPGTFGLLGVGVIGLGAFLRRRQV